jgi:hypothetical protein
VVRDERDVDLLLLGGRDGHDIGPRRIPVGHPAATQPGDHRCRGIGVGALRDDGGGQHPHLVHVQPRQVRRLGAEHERTPLDRDARVAM